MSYILFGSLFIFSNVLLLVACSNVQSSNGNRPMVVPSRQVQPQVISVPTVRGR